MCLFLSIFRKRIRLFYYNSSYWSFDSLVKVINFSSVHHAVKHLENGSYRYR